MPGPVTAEPADHPHLNVRRHRCTERTLTRRSLAITELASPGANLSAAFSRNSSRNRWRSAGNPPPCEYRMPR